MEFVVLVVMLYIGVTPSIQLNITTDGQTGQTQNDSNANYLQTTESYGGSNTKRFCLMMLSKVAFTNCSVNENGSCPLYCESITRLNKSVEEYTIVCASTGDWMPDVDHVCSREYPGAGGDISSNLLYLIGIVILAIAVLVVVVIVWRGRGHFHCAITEHFQMSVDFQNNQKK